MLRTQHIVVESNLNSIGGLTMLLGGLMVLGSVLPLVVEGGAIGGLLGLLVGGLTLLWGMLLRLRCCRRLSRWTSLLWLPVFPLGTLMGGYVFWALTSAHGEVLFSPQYREVVAQTQQIRAPTPMGVRVVVGLCIALLLWRLLAG